MDFDSSLVGTYFTYQHIFFLPLLLPGLPLERLGRSDVQRVGCTYSTISRESDLKKEIVPTCVNNGNIDLLSPFLI